MLPSSSIRRTARVRVAAGVADALRHAWAPSGGERCGLLLGSWQGETCRVLAAVAARNRARERNRFELEPHDFVTTWAVAGRDGVDVVGVWHTHPHGAGRPSADDCRAAWPEHVQAIVAAGGGAPRLRVWHCAGDVARELEMTEEVAR